MFRKKVTHVTEKSDGHSRILAVERLSQPEERAPSSPPNYADELFRVFENDFVGQYELVAICMLANDHNKVIHMADVVYHTEKHQQILISDPQALIQNHKAILASCQDVSDESNELLLGFIAKQSEAMPVEARYPLWEAILRYAIEAYPLDEKVHPMQMIIDHMVHLLCGRPINHEPKPVDIQQSKAEILIQNARAMREKPVIVGQHFWSKGKREMEKAKDSAPATAKCMLF